MIFQGQVYPTKNLKKSSANTAGYVSTGEIRKELPSRTVPGMFVNFSNQEMRRFNSWYPKKISGIAEDLHLRDTMLIWRVKFG